MKSCEYKKKIDKKSNDLLKRLDEYASWMVHEGNYLKKAIKEIKEEIKKEE